MALPTGDNYLTSGYVAVTRKIALLHDLHTWMPLIIEVVGCSKTG